MEEVTAELLVSWPGEEGCDKDQQQGPSKSLKSMNGGWMGGG